MHDHEVDIDVRLVQRLISTQFPLWANLPLAPVESAGTVNTVYRLGTDMAVRLPRIEEALNDVEKEWRWLPRLARVLPVPIPVPLAKGEPADGYPWPWSVTRWLRGDNPVVGRLTDPLRLAKDLGDFVRALHRVEAKNGPPSYRGVPLAARDTATRTAIAALHGIIDTEAATAAWKDALLVPAWTGPPVWIHADLSPGNVLVSNGRLAAVLDFGTLGVGDPAVDAIAAWNLLPPGARESFRAALAIDDATWARGRGWALSIALIQLPYYRTTNPVLADNARHVIGTICG
ncbi:aminoglycoside phosphotransferase family protein [Pendulispora rubella]|uniref:Aminoglycoside phosphotransferase family protein n=1 Tax=Pendulispora rubella TaxID=2741070 RepID=A0ABZ2KWQ1_9BACT